MKGVFLIIGLLLTGVLAWLLWLGGGMRTVYSLWLITQVEPYQQQVADAPTILVLGDSTAYGTGATQAADSIAGRIGAAYPSYSVRTQAKNGITVDSLQARIHDWVDFDTRYPLIVVQIGANDVRGDAAIASIISQVDKLVLTLQPVADEIVWLSSGNIGAATAVAPSAVSRLTERSRQFAVAAEQLADQYEAVAYVNLFREPDEDVFVADPSRYLAIDGLHPSSDGYAVWFSSLEPVLEERLTD